MSTYNIKEYVYNKGKEMGRIFAKDMIKAMPEDIKETFLKLTYSELLNILVSDIEILKQIPIHNDVTKEDVIFYKDQYFDGFCAGVWEVKEEIKKRNMEE